MKKEYKKPLVEMVEFISKNDIMTDDDIGVDDEIDMSQGVEEW